MTSFALKLTPARLSLEPWLRVVALVTLMLVGAGPLCSRAQEASFSEYEVKAAWLLNFARFVNWPTNAFTSSASPIVVGVAGKDPFGRSLEEAFNGKTVKGRPLVVKRPATDLELRQCHILFVSVSERRRFRDISEKLRTQAVLTVGEADDFLDAGGIVNFVLKEKSIRFEINVQAAQTAGLKMEANLLKVAVSVRGKYE